MTDTLITIVLAVFICTLINTSSFSPLATRWYHKGQLIETRHSVESFQSNKLALKISTRTVVEKVSSPMRDSVHDKNLMFESSQKDIDAAEEAEALDNIERSIREYAILKGFFDDNWEQS